MFESSVFIDRLPLTKPQTTEGLTLAERVPVLQKLTLALKHLDQQHYESSFAALEDRLCSTDTPVTDEEADRQARADSDRLKPEIMYLVLRGLYNDDRVEKSLGYLRQYVSSAEPQVRQVGLSLIERNLSRLEHVVSANYSYDVRSEGLETIYQLLHQGEDERQKPAATEILTRSLRMIAEDGLPKSSVETRNYLNSCDTILREVMVQSPPYLYREVGSAVGTLLNSPREGVRGWGLDALMMYGRRIRRENYPLMYDLMPRLTDMGHEIDEGYRETAESLRGEAAVLYEKQILENFRMVVALERIEPGMTSTLYRETGLVNFGRYPLDLLLRQYDNRGRDIPRAIVWSSLFDHNRGLWISHYLSELSAQMEELDFGLDVFEGRGVLGELMDKQEENINLVVVNAHGASDLVQMEPDNPIGVLVLEKMAWRAKEKGRSLYIVLDSCETGAFSGIAQAISKLGGESVVVVGPQKAAFLGSLKEVVDDQKHLVDVVPHYFAPGEGGKIVPVELAVYRNGEIVKTGE